MAVGSRDITERWEAQELPRWSEETHRKLVTISPDAATVFDMNGRVTFVFPQTLKLRGLEREEEMLGMDATQLPEPEDREKAWALCRLMLEEGKVKGADIRALRKDGSSVLVGLSVALLRDVRVVPWGMVTLTQDIPERKAMDMELRNRDEELEAFPALPSYII